MKPQVLGTDKDKAILDEIDVKTGEEDEIMVRHTTGKLYQFNKETKIYDERGTGTIRLLDPDRRHDESPGSSRLTMRGSGTHASFSKENRLFFFILLIRFFF